MIASSERFDSEARGASHKATEPMVCVAEMNTAFDIALTIDCPKFAANSQSRLVLAFALALQDAGEVCFLEARRYPLAPRR